MKAHGNTLNKNAPTVDIPWLIKWFKEIADEVGDVAPVRVRLQKTVDGKMKKFYNREDTDLLYMGFCVRRDARSCIRGGATAEETEEMGLRTTSAPEMRSVSFCIPGGFRKEYTKDKTQVTGLDPEVDVAVVNAAPLHQILQSGKKKLVVYADIATDTYQFNLVISFLLVQVDVGVLERVDYKFLRQRPHEQFVRPNIWAHPHVCSPSRLLDTGPSTGRGVDSASSNRTVHISHDDGFFRGYMSVVKELYKTLTTKIPHVVWVPEEFSRDEIKAALSKEQDDSVKAAKQSPYQHRAAMAIAAKETQDQRGRGVQEEEDEGHRRRRRRRSSSGYEEAP
ncbi:hypothetical protein ON010_g5780 [Phytophthora cinnamomi]|nr:hypothetical protein ON010_g5780 [Phytophthora cinnamomi]